MRRFMMKVLDLLRTYALIVAALLSPRNRRKIVFAAWGGDSFSDSPKYLMLECLRRGGFDCIWIGKPHLREAVVACSGARFVERGTLRALVHELTAGVFVYNIHFSSESCRVPPCGRVMLLNLWHGVPLKRIGRFQLDGKGAATAEAAQGILPLWKRLFAPLRALNAYVCHLAFRERSWTSVSSESVGRLFLEAFPDEMSVDRMLLAGLARNDYLVRNARNMDEIRRVKRKYAALFGISPERRWYLYLPTWRHCDATPFSFATAVCRASIERVLSDQNAVLVEKQHPIVLKRLSDIIGQNGPIVVLSREDAERIDVQELLMASDRLITDYSSCFFDFELMDRPVIHYAYDRDWYERVDSGVFLNLDDVAAGPIVGDEGALVDALSKSDADLLRLRAPHAREPIACEKGHACDALLELLAQGRVKDKGSVVM